MTDKQIKACLSAMEPIVAANAFFLSERNSSEIL